MKRWTVILAGWIAAHATWAECVEGAIRYPFTQVLIRESAPPAFCPAKPSKRLAGICFTENFPNYAAADGRNPSRVSDGKKIVFDEKNPMDRFQGDEGRGKQCRTGGNRHILDSRSAPVQSTTWFRETGVAEEEVHGEMKIGNSC